VTAVRDEPVTGTTVVGPSDSYTVAWVDRLAAVRAVALIAAVCGPALVALAVTGPVACVVTGLAALAVAFVVGKVVQWTAWAAKSRRADRRLHVAAVASSHTVRIVEQEKTDA
jgi:hypothetical protein